MKKTNKMATIVEKTRRGSMTYTERRIYEDENGTENVRFDGSWFTLDYIRNLSTTFKVNIWF
jgi:hypothetical protein